MFRLTNTLKVFPVLPLLMVLGLSACGQQQEAGETTADAELPKPTRIGSTAPSVGEFGNIQESSLFYKHQLDGSRTGHYGFGESATPEMIAGWDIDVRPDGQGLPEGSGTAEDGEPLYEKKCSTCHGVFGEGAGRWPKLAGREELTGERPEKTIGSFWPYASTLWDYIHRAMPFFEPQSLTDDEVYAITAYVLYLNEIVEYDEELNQESLPAIEMPNRDGFFEDVRPDVSNVACMENCKNPDEIKITWDSTELGVTPVDHLKLEEETAEQARAVINGEDVYRQACQLCHAPGLAGAPVTGDQAVWAVRKQKGRDVLVEHAVLGFQGDTGVMPPKGGQTQLTEDEVAAAVDYILSK